jgi:adenosylhomocysteine nucleosidase
MIPKPLIVIALHNEADGLLETMGFEVLYCGVGKVNATYHLTRRLSQSNRDFSYILNVGSAGSHVYSKGELVASNRFIQRDMDVTGLSFALGETPYDTSPSIITFSKRFEHLQHGTCVTGDSFLQEQNCYSGDIVDMEAYAL